MNQILGIVVFGLFVMGILASDSAVFAEQNTLTYYGKGTADEPSHFAGEVIRTIIDGDMATIIRPGNSGIELIRLDITTSDVCIQTEVTFCYDGVVTDTKNTNLHKSGDEVGITLDLANKKQIIAVNSGTMQGTTITIDLSKTIIKSDAPFVISATREGGFAGFPPRTISIDSSMNSITISDPSQDSTYDLTEDQLKEMTSKIKKSNLLNIFQSDYPPYPSSADYFTYTLELTQGAFQKTFTWTDTSDGVPGRLRSLIDAITLLSENIAIDDQSDPIVDIALDFVRSAPTFAFDGMEETLGVSEIMALESFPEQYRLEVSFTSAHGGFGDRTGQIVTQALTPHVMEIIISEGAVISAVTDGQWDELNRQYILEKS
ncbi:MAG: hypothetical protein WAO91_07450 [Candidatus Nitrosotenuis sp.]